TQTGLIALFELMHSRGKGTDIGDTQAELLAICKGDRHGLFIDSRQPDVDELPGLNLKIAVEHEGLGDTILFDHSFEAVHFGNVISHGEECQMKNF
ncbi:MAG: hypothetical protein U1D33_01735, partial [bacterium]|nr:hypothetical protein [bacterium]